MRALHEGSPGRSVVVGLLVAALVGAVAWTVSVVREDSGAVAPPLGAVGPGEVEPVPLSPPVEPIDGHPASPAEGDFAELATAAELEHPDTDPHIRRWYDWFGYFLEDEDIPRGEWTNKRELWDSLVPGVRAVAVTMGEPFDWPLFDGDTAQPALVNSSYSTADTGGLGEVVDIAITYQNADARVVMRYWPALIQVDATGAGTVIAELEAYELFVSDYGSYDDLLDAVADATRARVREYLDGEREQRG